MDFVTCFARGLLVVGGIHSQAVGEALVQQCFSTVPVRR